MTRRAGVPRVVDWEWGQAEPLAEEFAAQLRRSGRVILATIIPIKTPYFARIDGQIICFLRPATAEESAEYMEHRDVHACPANWPQYIAVTD